MFLLISAAVYLVISLAFVLFIDRWVDRLYHPSATVRNSRLTPMPLGRGGRR